MFIRSREAIAFDPESNGKLKTIAPNRILEMPDHLARALMDAYPDLIVEVEQREFETATAGPQRKRRF